MTFHLSTAETASLQRNQLLVSSEVSFGSLEELRDLFLVP